MKLQGLVRRTRLEHRMTRETPLNLANSITLNPDCFADKPTCGLLPARLKPASTPAGRRLQRHWHERCQCWCRQLVASCGRVQGPDARQIGIKAHTTACRLSRMKSQSGSTWQAWPRASGTDSTAFFSSSRTTYRNGKRYAYCQFVNESRSALQTLILQMLIQFNQFLCLSQCFTALSTVRILKLINSKVDGGVSQCN